MVLFGMKIYKDSDSFNLRCIISKVDGNTYCVRERSKVELAADLLAEATKKMKRLVEHMNSKHASNPAVKRLVENFNPDKPFFGKSLIQFVFGAFDYPVNRE